MSGLVGYKSTPITIITGADEPSAKEWRFDNLGNITLPLGGDIVDNNGISLLGADSGVRKTTSSIVPGEPTVIWTGFDSAVSSAKLFVQVECEVIGDPTGAHSQSCEIIVASRGDQFVPNISVYGLVYTSVSPLATFTAQRNGVTNRIEIVGTPAFITSSEPLVRIYSIEQLSRI